MLDREDTKLEIFTFGDDEADSFYCLVNLKKNPEGIDLEKLSMADPRKFDEILDRMGCIFMLQGDEVEELIRRKELTGPDLHRSLYELAVREELIQ